MTYLDMYRSLNKVLSALNNSNNHLDQGLADDIADVMDILWYKRLTEDERKEFNGST